MNGWIEWRMHARDSHEGLAMYIGGVEIHKRLKMRRMMNLKKKMTGIQWVAIGGMAVMVKKLGIRRIII